MSEIIQGDSLTVLKGLPDQHVNCVVTSPPYYGLRDYGVLGQMGLEPTPDEYVQKMVELFREVRRVLMDDGTLWLNIGDSYAGYLGNESYKQGEATPSDKRAYTQNKRRTIAAMKAKCGLKPKDLIGIPWALAKALRDPYYTGNIKREMDRVWLAAMVDAEGSICGTEYQTGDRTKTNIYISITNTSIPIINKCERLFPQNLKHIYEKTNGNSNRRCFRWDVEHMETKSLFIREIYPYLVAKRKQAILGYTFLELQRGLVSKKKGYLPNQHEQRSWLMASLSRLNAGEDVDLPDWVIEPPSLFEQGWFLRQDVVWHKPNPMPESVTDRCTKSHEYIFLLSKKQKYYYDIDSIRTPVRDGTAQRMMQQIENQKGSDRVPGKTNGNMKAVGPGRKPRAGVDTKGGNQASETGIKAYSHRGSGDKKITGHSGNFDRDGNLIGDGYANKKSVWTVTTKPFKEAHFATFPEDLIVDCIKAGCPTEGIVLDPFMGAGTTGLVAAKLYRNFIGIELNPKYIEIARKRLRDELGIFNPLK